MKRPIPRQTITATDAVEQLRKDNKFLAELMLVKFAPTNYCLTLPERRQLSECYGRTFTKTPP